MSNEEDLLRAAIARVLESPSRKKLIVAGPGTGKTTLFRLMLEGSEGSPDNFLVLTFINNLRNDLERDLSGYARVSTLHSYCLGLLYNTPSLRSGLSSTFRCFPGLGSLIRADWTHIEDSQAPHFIREMRGLSEDNHIQFYLERGSYYDAVDFDDTVYRVLHHARSAPEALGAYNLVLIDEYQDFNRMEAGIISLLSDESPILIVGDDDQALYSQLRDSSWDYIRELYRNGAYEIHELPFCMRSPRVIIEAVNNVIAQARQRHKLQGRIEKPYRYFAPIKDPDSKSYPNIDLVRTSVQRKNANYMGRYIAHAINSIPRDEIDEASSGGYPPILVIAADPYRSQIVEHLEGEGFNVDTRREPSPRIDRLSAFEILTEENFSNLGWRILLEAEKPTFLSEAICQTADISQQLFNVVPPDFKDRILDELKTWIPPNGEETDLDADDNHQREPKVRVTSFEGAKGLSAQHVFIAGLHNGELPRDPNEIQDLEICKFIVGLTRTCKKCYLLFTRRFANQWKSPSEFLSWIDDDCLSYINVDKQFWDDTP